MQYLLRVEVVDDPEHELEMNALDKGNLIHELLDRFVREAIEAGRVPPWGDDDRRRLRAIADEVAAEYGARGATGRAMFWRRDRARILGDLERFAAEDRGHPIHSAFRFTNAGYPLPDGRSGRGDGCGSGSRHLRVVGERDVPGTRPEALPPTIAHHTHDPRAVLTPLAVVYAAVTNGSGALVWFDPRGRLRVMPMDKVDSG
jgi:hypothetical protein